MKNKILIIIGSLEGGGAEKVLITILKNIDYNENCVDLCLIEKKGIYISEVPKVVKIKVLYKKFGRIFRKIDSIVYKKYNICILEKIRINLIIRKKYDTIISFLEGEPLKFHSYIIRKAKNNISWVHTDLFHYHESINNSFSKRHEKNAYSRVDKIVFVSKESLQQFKKIYNIGDKGYVIYNPIDMRSIIALSSEEKIYKRCFTICCIGRLCKEKAFERIINTVKILKNNGYRIECWIIGEGELKSSLLKLVGNLSLSDEVKLFGFKKNPYPYLKECDIFVSTSIVEGFPLVICEALCLGKPIVATSCTGSREILGNGKYGILTEHSESSIYEAIKTLYNDPQLIICYKKLAFERSKMLNLNSTMKKIEAILRVAE